MQTILSHVRRILDHRKLGFDVRWTTDPLNKNLISCNNQVEFRWPTTYFFPASQLTSTASAGLVSTYLSFHPKAPLISLHTRKIMSVNHQSRWRRPFIITQSREESLSQESDDQTICVVSHTAIARSQSPSGRQKTTQRRQNQTKKRFSRIFNPCTFYLHFFTQRKQQQNYDNPSATFRNPRQRLTLHSCHRTCDNSKQSLINTSCKE